MGMNCFQVERLLFAAITLVSSAYLNQILLHFITLECARPFNVSVIEVKNNSPKAHYM